MSLWRRALQFQFIGKLPHQQHCLCKNFPVLEKIEDPLVILDKLKEIRRTLEDTLALSALYLKDAREFPFDDPEFSELQKEIIELLKRS